MITRKYSHCLFAITLATLWLGEISLAATTVSRNINADTTWGLGGSPYVIEKGIHISDGAQLTIDPGVEVRFAAGAGIQIGWYSNGAIRAIGTMGSPIRFTSNQPNPDRGDWGSLLFTSYTDNANTVFEYCVFEYGGSSREAMLEIQTAAPTIRNCEISYSESNAISVRANSNGSKPSLVNNHIDGNRLGGLIIDGNSSQSVVRGNLFEGNGAQPISAEANALGALKENTFRANFEHTIQVLGGYVRVSQTISNMGIPYIVTGSSILVADEAQLNIEPGVILRFSSGTGLETYRYSPGAIRIQGESANPVLLTSNQEFPYAGDWVGVQLYGSDPVSSEIRNCIIEYAGQGGNGAVFIRGTSPTISNSTIRNNSGDGIQIYRNYNCNPTISRNNIYANGRFDLNNELNTQILARGNWWGSAGGPAAINGPVDTAGYLSTPVLIGFPRSPLLSYFPHFAAGAGWKSVLYLQNLELIDAAVDLHFFDDHGDEVDVRIDGTEDSAFQLMVPTRGSRIVEISGSKLASGWLEVDPRQRVLSSLVFQYSSGGKVASAAGVPASPIGEEFHITFSNQKSRSAFVGLAVSNPNDEAIEVEVSLYDSQGILYSKQRIDIAAFGHKARFIHELFPESADWNGYLKLAADLGFITVPLKLDGGLISTIPAACTR